MAKYLGLDTSSKAIHGAVVNDAEELVGLYKWSSNQKSAGERFPEIIVDFSEELSKIDITEKAAIEAAIFVQNRKSLISLSNMIGAVWAVLVLNNIDTSLIHHAGWKKEVLGKGSLKKDDIMSFAIEKWGNKFPEQDYADAACIALWNRRRF
jgi:Holliday junction resolvasome RuvABC endonuclease subunit|tara:strand:- start:5 stop:460 length:456 start_codon:yes stop_codon:yes gene_type:complete